MENILSRSYAVTKEQATTKANTGILRCAQNDNQDSLAELFAETPDAERDQCEREEEQSQEVGPDGHEAASFEHGAANDRGEVVDGVEHGERLEPLGHRFDRIERAGE